MKAHFPTRHRSKVALVILIAAITIAATMVPTMARIVQVLLLAGVGISFLVNIAVAFVAQPHPKFVPQSIVANRAMQFARCLPPLITLLAGGWIALGFNEAYELGKVAGHLGILGSQTIQIFLAFGTVILVYLWMLLLIDLLRLRKEGRMRMAGDILRGLQSRYDLLNSIPQDRHATLKRISVKAAEIFTKPLLCVIMGIMFGPGVVFVYAIMPIFEFMKILYAGP